MKSRTTILFITENNLVLMNDTCMVIVIFRACKYSAFIADFRCCWVSYCLFSSVAFQEKGGLHRESILEIDDACVRIIIIHVPTSSVRQINREEIWRCMRAAYTVITIVLLFAFFTLSTFLEKIKFCSSLYFFFSRRILFPSQYFWVVRTASSFLSITC